MLSIPQSTDYTDLRDGVRAVCNQFDSAYWQQVDDVRGYPEAFVQALTDAGWLSALIWVVWGLGVVGLLALAGLGHWLVGRLAPPTSGRPA